MKVGLYFHTLRYLKAKQIFFQLLRRIYKPKVKRIKIDVPLRSKPKAFAEPLQRKVSLVGPEKHDFFGEDGELEVVGWFGKDKEKLWRYNQHYFDDLNAVDASQRENWHIGLIEHWVLNNLSELTVGWESYPLSLRIVNWIKWDIARSSLSALGRQSLYRQGLVLEKKLEYHILGNHLFANAKALVFIGCYFSGPEPDRWLRKGIEIIGKELGEQVLDDGGNFELSPMYHCLFLEDVLDLVNILRAYSPPSFESPLVALSGVLPKMLRWLEQMIFFDGNVSYFNDSASNVAGEPRAIFDYAKRLGFEVAPSVAGKEVTYKHLAESGYISVVRGDLKMILDVARLGPDYLLAHAHADTLAFELAIGTQRFFVNSGTSCYGHGSRREFERSTRAHNCVEIDGLSSSEVWSSFRVARRAYPIDLSVNELQGSLLVKCSHDGYARLDGSPRHTRSWAVERQKIAISDEVTGVFNSAMARFILHANVAVKMIDKKTFGLTANGTALTFSVLRGAPLLIDWQHTDEFGFLSSTKCIEIALETGQSKVEIY